ncbi:MAG: iron-containing alcohol dehydrogenase [Candidatus Marinimicrobia bacterium]|nr:iron-containing alcohol dehydrogenase [Candidatus Neomarinimicrobiota bacterium]
MIQYNYPTTIFYGEDSIESLPNAILKDEVYKILIVTDQGIVDAGIADKMVSVCTKNGLKVGIFSDIHTNPLEEDVLKARQFFIEGGYEALIGLGGGSAMDVAKTIKFIAVHELPLSQYNDAIGGDALIVNKMPPLYAIPTTAGTGSEVGRSSVVTIKKTDRKTIFFHPNLMPDIAVLDPNLTKNLPPHITAATGIDAFSHCLEAYLVDSFHPMADALALQGIEMVLTNLPKVIENGNNMVARGQMQLAATIGATAFQKGLGMIHSIAHALSTISNTHHGLANALAMIECIDFTLKKAEKNSFETLKFKLKKINRLFSNNNSLTENIKHFIVDLNIILGLENHNFIKDDINKLAMIAHEDACHQTHPFIVSKNDFTFVITKCFNE